MFRFTINPASVAPEARSNPKQTTREEVGPENVETINAIHDPAASESVNNVTAAIGATALGTKATDANVIHVGIALSPDWMIHASGQGVYVSSLHEQWRRDEFAWARRVL